MTEHFPAAGRLPLPARLLRLLESGHWPRTPEEARKQNSHLLVPKERIQLFAPEESVIYLYPPPFRTVAAHIDDVEKRFGVDRFWATYAALEGISPELSLVVGDFGIGSDAPIVVDYRQVSSNPPVLRLLWRKPEPNVWVRCADSFDEFANLLELDRVVDRLRGGV